MSSNADNVDILDVTKEEEEEDYFGLFGDEVEGVFDPEVAASDTLEPLTAREGKLFTATQAVDFVQQPSQGSARASLPSRSWAQEVEEEEAASQGGVHVGPGTQGLHHPSGVSLGDIPMDGVELGHHQPEPLEEELAREARRKACYQAAQQIFSGCGSGLPAPPDTMELESVDTLRGWFLPEAGSIWSEVDVLRKLGKLTLVPAQQALVDNGLREDQWHLPKD